MTTSGTSTFSRNRDQIIGDALEIVNAFELGETPDSAAVTQASNALNVMVKHWQGADIHIWTSTEAVLFPQVDQVRYSIGSASTDFATESYVSTALTSAAALGDGTVVLDSVTSVATTYNIGVQLDDGTLQWTTINGAPSGYTVTLTAVLTDSAAAGNLVIVYQTALVRPLRILSARRYNYDSAIDIPMNEMDRIEYQEMPNKTTSGSVNSFYYDRRGGANSLAYLYLWPAPSTVNEAIKMTVARPIQDFSAAANDADFPQEWLQALTWNLADQLSLRYAVPRPERAEIKARAAQYLAEANWYERELLSFQFVPDRGR